MDYTSLVLLTKNTSSLPIFGPIWNLIVNILGQIMNIIYIGLETIGIGNIGLAIIIFTLVTRILLFPTSLKQQRSSRMMQLMQPEIKKIQEKYKNKTDTASMAAQKAEMDAVYEKYGTSMTGGCLPLLLQMPIIFALYRIIMNIPAYVPSVYNVYANVRDAIGGHAVADQLVKFATDNKMEAILKSVNNLGVGKEGVAVEQVDNLIIDFLYKLNPDQWKLLPNVFPDAAETISNAASQASHINDFLGLNLSTAPSAMGFTPNAYWLIPILAGLLQWLSTVLMQNQNKAMTDGNEQSAQMMKSMNIMMPLMSVWFCFSFASGIGLYWCASSAFMILQQLILNKYFAGQTDEEILQKSMEKVNAKRAKKGLPPIDEKSVETKIKKAQESLNKVEEKRMDIIAKQNIKTKESTDYYQKNAKPGSLASKANMVQMFNDKQDKEKNNH